MLREMSDYVDNYDEEFGVWTKMPIYRDENGENPSFVPVHLRKAAKEEGIAFMSHSQGVVQLKILDGSGI